MTTRSLFLFFCGIACLFLVDISTSVRGQDDSDVDRGTSDPLILAKQALENQWNDAVQENLTSVQRVALIRLYESQVRKLKGKVPQQEYWREISNVGSMYWQNRAHQEATRVYDDVVDGSPGTLPAAKAYLMKGWIEYGNRGNPAGAVPALEQAVELVKQLPGEDNFARNELAARALSTLGDVYMILGRDDDAAAQYRYLLENPEIIDAAEESALINANAEWARILTKQGKFEEADERYRELDQLVKDSELPASMRIAFSLESWRAQARKTMSESDTVLFLEELWFGEQESDELQLLYLGNNLSLFYFFSETEEQNQKFPDFSKDLLKKAKDVYKAHASEFSSDDSQSYHSIVLQTYLMQLHLAKEADEPRKIERIKAAFKDEFKKVDNRFTPFVSTKFPGKVASTLMNYFREYVEADMRNSVLELEADDAGKVEEKDARGIK